MNLKMLRRNTPAVGSPPRGPTAKVVCFDYAGGDGLVFEGAANSRPNGNLEQLTATGGRALHDWHAGWIDDVVSADGEG